MRKDLESGLLVIESDADIPPFASEAEEAEFWGSHTFSDEMLDEFRPLDDEELPFISFKFEPALTRRLYQLAARRGLRPNALARQFICERLAEEEQRESAAG